MPISTTRTFEKLLANIQIAANGETIGPVSTRNKAIAGVYVLYLVESDSYYIGSSKNIGLRFLAHKSKLRNNNHPCPKFQEAYNKCENKTIKITYIEISRDKRLERLEQRLIDRYYDTGLILNASRDSSSPMGGRNHTEETKELLRMRTNEQFSDPKSRKRHSEITKEKMKDPDLFERIKEAQKKGIAEYKSRVNISERQKALWTRPGAKETHREACAQNFRRCVVDGVEYDSAAAAAKAHGISAFGMGARLKNPTQLFSYYVGEEKKVDPEFKTELERVLAIDLDSAKKGHGVVKKDIHSFPAVFILYFEGADKFFISHGKDLFRSICVLVAEMKSSKSVKKKKPLLAEAYSSHENKNIRVSWIPCKSDFERGVLVTQLIQKHRPSGKLLVDYCKVNWN